MAGSITPLPIMLAELPEEDRAIYEKLEIPKTLVVKYGSQKLIAELPYDGDRTPGCGTKLVIRTDRGIELAEMVTTTCSNSGCGSSISRKEMLQYIERSGGKDFPFTTQGRILRIATTEDLHEQNHLNGTKPKMMQETRELIRRMDLGMKLVEVELLLGGDRILFYYTAEQWVDFRELVRELASQHQTRIEMIQLNDREEARLVADYERCGQQCCCKQFLKVLKPVSMRSAKVQKATLDPNKISGRCGRLMCCLRYEDKTYEDLRKRLPHRKTRVLTEDGPGQVVGGQILTQLVMVELEQSGKYQAYPLEDIDLDYDGPTDAVKHRPRSEEDFGHAQAREALRTPASHGQEDDAPTAAPATGDDEQTAPAEPPRRSKRRRRRRGGGGGGGGGSGGDARGDSDGGNQAPPSSDQNTQRPQESGEAGGSSGGEPGSGGRRKRRRRRKRGGGGGGGGSGGGQGSPGGGDGGGSGD